MTHINYIFNVNTLNAVKMMFRVNNDDAQIDVLILKYAHSSECLQFHTSGFNAMLWVNS